MARHSRKAEDEKADNLVLSRVQSREADDLTQSCYSYAGQI